VLRLAAEGVTRQEIAARLGIGVASVYRIIADASTAAAGLPADAPNLEGRTPRR
jgi:transposase